MEKPILDKSKSFPLANVFTSKGLSSGRLLLKRKNVKYPGIKNKGSTYLMERKILSLLNVSVTFVQVSQQLLKPSLGCDILLNRL